MADANIRVINITLNPFELRNEDSNFEIRCGENVRLVFSLPEDVGDLQLTESGTLQVEAINALNGFKALAKEGTYTVGALSELNAQIEFTTAQTAYGSTQAGAYNLIVALKDSSGNVVLSGVVPFNLYDVGYDGIMEPPESFRDEVLEAADRAVTASDNAQNSEQQAKIAEMSAKSASTSANQAALNAKNSAESASDSASNALISEKNAEQSKNAANNSELSAQASAELAASLVVNATELGQIKTDKGVLHCFVEGDYSSNKGSIYGVLASQLTFPLSVLWRGKFEFVTTKSTYMLSLGGTGANSDIRITIAQYSDYAVRIQIGTSALIPTFSNPNVIANALSGGNVDSFGLIITESDGAYMGKFYVNGSLLGESTSAVVPTGFTNSSNYAFNRSRSGALGTSDADYADICIFNFDVSASNAPYTIADYHVGRVIPARLLNVNSSQRALLALENYVFTNGSTKIIPDYSGNLTDASALGSVVGDNDTKIARLTSLINSQVPTA